MGKPDEEETASDDIQFPTTLEEFLESEKLDDWPYPMALEGPLDVDGESLLWGTRKDITEILKESAPLGLGLLSEIETRLAQVEEKLNSYAVYIVTDDKRPSRLADHLFHSPFHTFLTEASESDIVKSQNRSRDHENADFADAMMETKKRCMDYCIFPGFHHGELVELPAQLEALQLLHKITKIQNFNPGFRHFWKKLFLSEASAAVMQDAFWWIFLDQFSKMGGLAKEKDLLFDRIADSYVALFTNINADVKDKFLSVYPNYLSQAIYLAYITAFPESQWRFDDQFKQYLVNIIHEWTTGLKPVLGTWKQWDVAKLKTYGTDGSGEAGATTKKIMEAAALNKKMEISLDMDAFNKIVEKLGEDSELPQPEPHEVGELTSVAVTTMTPLRLPRESHQVDPGLEYERVKFNIQGHSPLIAHYLHIRRLRDFRQPGKKIRRTEITKLPHPGPTYQQFLQTKLVMSSALKTEYNRICETTNTEILELENRKREMHRNIDQLKKDLKMAKNSIERRAILERAINLKDRDSETPLLYHRSQSSLTEISANSEDN